MAHKVWSEEENKWVEPPMERIVELQQNAVKPGMSVPLPPIHPQGDQGQELPLPEGLEEGDTVWLVYNEQLNLDRAR